MLSKNIQNFIWGEIVHSGDGVVVSGAEYK